MLLVAVALVLGACNGEIYLRDGVTDGDTFYLSQRALRDPDPVLQSWVSYSLTKSACQLRIGGDNPARATSFECELAGREHLLETWSELGAASADDYLDRLQQVRDAGYLDEYVWEFLRRSSWMEPAGLDLASFAGWRREHLRRHEPRTRLIGYWGYRSEGAGENSRS
ncbi:MAG TPA: hypothetical protein VE175_03270 [Woeseiaceae bacterium]|jgi:hypothetical protein|nr:hypothetical protein [Woeseiaceae bacterium]